MTGEAVLLCSEAVLLLSSEAVLPSRESSPVPCFAR
jgi:hypothetical protein